MKDPIESWGALFYPPLPLFLADNKPKEPENVGK
jgi:hypothetical protein